MHKCWQELDYWVVGYLTIPFQLCTFYSIKLKEGCEGWTGNGLDKRKIAFDGMRFLKSTAGHELFVLPSVSVIELFYITSIKWGIKNTFGNFVYSSSTFFHSYWTSDSLYSKYLRRAFWITTFTCNIRTRWHVFYVLGIYQFFKEHYIL